MMRAAIVAFVLAFTAILLGAAIVFALSASGALASGSVFARVPTIDGAAGSAILNKADVATP
jgi:hypothetical protein